MIPVRKYCSTIHHAQTAESTLEEFSLATGQDLNYCSVTTSARGVGHGANSKVWRSKGERYTCWTHFEPRWCISRLTLGLNPSYLKVWHKNGTVQLACNTLWISLHCSVSWKNRMKQPQTMYKGCEFSSLIFQLLSGYYYRTQRRLPRVKLVEHSPEKEFGWWEKA